MSHNAASHNVVLKITVPKRTGRRRKKGSNGPWEGDVGITNASAAGDNEGQVSSVARLDEPKMLRRKLQDNVGKYAVEAVGIIKRTHRFRALADFYWDMNKSSFARRYVDQVLQGDGTSLSSQTPLFFLQARVKASYLTLRAVQKMKQFAFEEGTDRPPNVDVLPPPIFTHMSLPFNYFYSQNPYVRTTEDGDTFNLTAVKQVGHFIGAEDPAPEGPQLAPDMTDPRMLEVMVQLEDAFQIRPVWTRRSLMNHLQGKLQSWNELKKYLNYAAYQFKGGPWRDSVVPYGLDPRSHPKYRVYQTLMFKLKKHKRILKDQSWTSVRRTQTTASHIIPDVASDSHVFDGETYSTDGKVWQVCDITDPLLKELLDNATTRPSCDVNSGWYHGGLWAKVKAIMKTKLVAIQFGRRLEREDFASTLEYGNMTPPRSSSISNTFHLPLPDLNLSSQELTTLRGREPPKKKSKWYNVRFRDSPSTPAVGTAEQSPVPTPTSTLAPFAAESSVANANKMDYEGGEDSGSEGGEDDDDDDGDGDDGSYGRVYGHEAEFVSHQNGYPHLQEEEDNDDGMGMSRITYPELD